MEGCRIGITGTPSFTGKLHKELSSLGGTVEYLLSLSLQSYRSDERMQAAYEDLKSYTWIVFTSANAVREFFLGLMEQGEDHRALGHIKFATVGKGTADELLKYGFRSDYTPKHYQVIDLAEGLRERITKHDRLLIPRSTRGSRELGKKGGKKNRQKVKEQILQRNSIISPLQVLPELTHFSKRIHWQH